MPALVVETADENSPPDCWAATDLVPIGGADLFHRRGIRAKPVSDDAARPAVLLHNPLEQLQRHGFGPLRRNHRLQDVAFTVNGVPKVAELAIDLHKHLIQMPAPLRIAAHLRDASLANLGGKDWAKPFHQNRTVSSLMSIPRWPANPRRCGARAGIDVHHHDQTDDLRRAVEISERIAHAPRLTQPGQPENLL